MAQRNKYCKILPLKEVEKNWGIGPIPMLKSEQFIDAHVIVVCRKDGSINWDKTSILSHKDLIGKTVVFLPSKQA